MIYAHLRPSCPHTPSSLPTLLPLASETQVDVWPSSACELGVTHQGIQSKKKGRSLLIGSFHGTSLEAAEFSVLEIELFNPIQPPLLGIGFCVWCV